MTNFNAFDFSKNPMFDPKNNPFLSGDFGTAFQKMDYPADLSDFFAPVRKNVEAVAAANKIVLDGVQAVLKRQGEILTGYANDAAVLVEDAKNGASADPQEVAVKSVDAAKVSLADTVANTRELSEILAKSQEEAFALMTARLGESLDEAKAAIVKMQPAAPAKAAKKASATK